MRMICLLGFLLALASCGPVPFERLGLAPTKFTWKDDSGARSAVSAARSASRSAAGTVVTDPSLDWTLNLYTTFGNKVGAYTPSKFRLWLDDAIVQANDDVRPGSTWIQLTNPASPREPADFTNGYMDRFYADFAGGSLDMVPPGGLPRGHRYSTVGVNFGLDQGGVLMTVIRPGKTFEGTYQVRSELVVDLPGYEGVFPASQGLTSSQLVAEHSSGSTYAIIPSALLPGRYDPAHPSGSQYFEKGIGTLGFFLVFTGNRYAVLYGASPFSFISAAIGDLQLPMAPFEVPSDAAEVHFRLNWDLTNIVEVYDNNTPADKSDDIVVLAPRFWERITLVPEVVR